MEGFVYERRGVSGAPCVDAQRPRVRVEKTSPAQHGVVPRAVNELFTRVQRALERAAAAGESEAETFCITVSFLQIYKERVYDLLNPHIPTSKDLGEEESSLRLRWDAARERFYVENLFQYECSSAEDVLKYYAAGVQNKQVAATAMNAQSSRSHAVLLLTLARRTTLEESKEAGISKAAPVREVVSNLVLVDLAGSERAASSGEGKNGVQRFKEAVNINQSLFVLRKVIAALAQRKDGRDDGGHIPYRESKLTSLLQHTIGGNAFMLMLACLSPADRHYEENLSTLQYATQAACIKNVPTVNLDPKDKLIQYLRARLEAAHAYILEHMGLDELPDELLTSEPASGPDSRTGNAGKRPQRRQRRRSAGSAPPVPHAPGVMYGSGGGGGGTGVNSYSSSSTSALYQAQAGTTSRVGGSFLSMASPRQTHLSKPPTSAKEEPLPPQHGMPTPRSDIRNSADSFLANMDARRHFSTSRTRSLPPQPHKIKPPLPPPPEPGGSGSHQVHKFQPMAMGKQQPSSPSGVQRDRLPPLGPPAGASSIQLCTAANPHLAMYGESQSSFSGKGNAHRKMRQRRSCSTGGFQSGPGPPSPRRAAMRSASVMHLSTRTSSSKDTTGELDETVLQRPVACVDAMMAEKQKLQDKLQASEGRIQDLESKLREAAQRAQALAQTEELNTLLGDGRTP